MNKKKYFCKEAKEGKAMPKQYLHLLLDAETHDDYFLYHYASTNVEKVKQKRLEILQLAKENNVYTFSMHTRWTNTKEFVSVAKLDPYFTVKQPLATTKKFFTKLILANKISVMDVAGLLVKQYHLQAFALQKILYYIYADYLVKYKTAPFVAEFAAWHNGPVEKDVYQAYKYYGDDYWCALYESYKSKVFSNDYMKLKQIIQNVVKEYRNHFTQMNNPPNLTHLPNTPWTITRQRNNDDKRINNEKILDQDIQKYHANETSLI